MVYLRVFMVGCVVGVLYGFSRIKSPAPPLIAIIGLTGMLAASVLLGPL